MDDVVAINFSRDVGWAGHEMLELVKGAPSTLDLSFNYDGRPEIGTWSATLPDDRFRAALAALETSGYDTLPNGPSVVQPDSKSLALGVRRAGEAMPRIRTFSIGRPPDQIAAVVRVLDAAIADIRKHPRSVLRGKAESRTREIHRGQELGVEVTLTGAGSQPLHLRNPSAGPGGEWCGIRFALVDARGGERVVDLKPGDVVSTAGRSEATIVLRPGETLALQLRAKIDWPPGSGMLRVEVTQTAEQSESSASFSGTLWLDAGPLTIARGSWWKFWH